MVASVDNLDLKPNCSLTKIFLLFMCSKGHAPRKDWMSISQEAGWATEKVRMCRKFRTHRVSILDRPACSQSLYRMGYQHTHTHTHTHIHIHTHTYTYIHIHIHTHTYTQTHTYTYTFTHTYTQTHTYTHILTHTYTKTHTYTHIHTYIDTH